METRGIILKSAILRNLGEKNHEVTTIPRFLNCRAQRWDYEYPLDLLNRANQRGLGACVLSVQQNEMHWREGAAAAASLTSIFPEQKVFLERRKKHQYLMRHRILTKLYIGKIIKNWESKKIPKLFLKFQKDLFSLKIKTVSYNTSE